MDISVVNAVERGKESEGETHGIIYKWRGKRKQEKEKKKKNTAREPLVSSKAKCFRGLGGYIDLNLEWYLRVRGSTAMFCFVTRYRQVLDPQVSG